MPTISEHRLALRSIIYLLYTALRDMGGVKLNILFIFIVTVGRNH